MHVMTKQAAVRNNLWAEYLKAIAPATGTFQHFETEQKKREHLKWVEENKHLTLF